MFWRIRALSEKDFLLGDASHPIRMHIPVIGWNTLQLYTGS